MTTETLLKKMEGLTVALATPFAENGDLDILGLERLVERVLAGGASCLFPLGWMGEQPLISDKVRRSMVEETCRLAKGKVPVMAGVTEQSLPRALEQARMAKNAGADLILSTPPYSYLIPQRAIVEYFHGLATQSGMPVVVYQNAEASSSISNDTLHELSQIPGIVGAKAYTPYLNLQHSFLRSNRPGHFAMMSGDEYVYGAALFLGIRHFTMGGPGNLCPGWCAQIYRDAVNGDWNAVLDKQKRLIAFCDELYSLEETSAYAAVKCALEHLGICSRRISSPHLPITAVQSKTIGNILEKYADVLE